MELGHGVAGDAGHEDVAVLGARDAEGLRYTDVRELLRPVRVAAGVLRDAVTLAVGDPDVALVVGDGALGERDPALGVAAARARACRGARGHRRPVVMELRHGVVHRLEWLRAVGGRRREAEVCQPDVAEQGHGTGGYRGPL